MAQALVIVESPAKCKTIGKYLGNKYEVKSCMGHVIDLPTKRMGVDVEHGFTPEYEVIKNKKKVLTELKKSSKDKKEIYLATDPDREGEAISWHLSNKLAKKSNKVYRVTFNEITPKAVTEAFKHPGTIDLNKVNAQQARRILDRIVGYSISPLLWKKIVRGLSAGRVQSVALRLIIEREKAIKAFLPQEYWQIEAELEKQIKKEKSFTAQLEKIDGEKPQLNGKEQTDDLLGEIKKQTFLVADIRKTEKKKSAPPPFITSTLQQDGFNKLGFPVNKTMKVAQELYEGIEINEEGPVGLITYMRTDSLRSSEESIKEVRSVIAKKFGKDYVPAEPNRYKSKKNAQGAHEAIRPTLVAKEPERIKKYLSEAQFKLYELIWQRFLASQMTPQVLEQTSVDIKAGRFLFRTSGSREIFAGFTVIYGRGEKENKIMPLLEVQEKLNLLKLTPSQHFTKPPPRFSDASLVKALEEEGIGRPSTYAPIIYTLVLRNYIQRQSGYIYPTELGMVTAELLIKHFPKILDIRFTAKMEEELDYIEEGKANWVELLNNFYPPFMETLNKAQINMRSVKKDVTPTDELCEQCGRPMVIKWGRNGKFISCSGFPKCKNAKAIPTGIKCLQPGCDGDLVKRRSKQGRSFYGCSNYPNCTYITRKLPDPDVKPNGNTQS